MPIIVKLRAAERIHRRGAAPEVVIHRGRNGLRTGGLADARTAFVAKAASKLDLAEIAFAQPRDGFDDGRARSALRARLDDAVVLARGVDELAAFPDFVRNRFLHIDILAGLDGPDGRERMPVVRRGDSDGIDIRVLQKFADVLVARHFLTAGICLVDFSIEDGAVDIAKRNEANALDIAEAGKVVLSASTKADDGDADIVVRAANAGVWEAELGMQPA